MRPITRHLNEEESSSAGPERESARTTHREAAHQETSLALVNSESSRTGRGIIASKEWVAFGKVAQSKRPSKIDRKGEELGRLAETVLPDCTENEPFIRKLIKAFMKCREGE
jgi:hypothetical protein